MFTNVSFSLFHGLWRFKFEVKGEFGLENEGNFFGMRKRHIFSFYLILLGLDPSNPSRHVSFPVIPLYIECGRRRRGREGGTGDGDR